MRRISKLDEVILIRLCRRGLAPSRLHPRGAIPGEYLSLCDPDHPGEYIVQIHATAPDAPDDWETSSVQVGSQQKAYIRVT